MVRLPDPDPDDPGRSTAEKWWPPVMLDARLDRRHEFDVFHVQFGFDACGPEELADSWRPCASAARRSSTPCTTCATPTTPTARRTTRSSTCCVPAADAVITLTPGAAAEIARAVGPRRPIVLPHPHVVELDRHGAAARRRPADGRRSGSGLHVKSLRASMDPLRLLPDLVEPVRELPGRACCRSTATATSSTPTAHRHDARLATYLRSDARGAGELELRVHDYFPDDELWGYLESPRRVGAALPLRHPLGLAEACRDLGTTVVAPTCGYYAEQGPVPQLLARRGRASTPTLSRPP